MKQDQNTYDYIIVGSGSAGAILAARLTEDEKIRVLLIEAGPVDNSIFIHMPIAFSMPLANDKYNWYYHSEPEPCMDNRRVYHPRGRVLGGSSSINGMVYQRGNPLDYERWQAQGAEGWSYADVLPYFKKTETRLIGGDAYRGADGPVEVSTGRCENPLFQAFIEAGQQAGYAYLDDMNGYRQEGVGPMDMTASRGKRNSTARAYLYEALKRPNLTLSLNTLTHKILFDGKTAAGVQCSPRKGGASEMFYADQQVLVCGGAFNSPQLLMLSGIGPADHLRQFDIDVVQDLPGVGQNLQDHIEVYVQYAACRPVSLYPALKPLGKLKLGAQWLLFKSGWGASNQFEAGGFIRSRAGVEYPDLQFHFLPMAVNYDGSSPAGGHGFQLHVGPMRPTSAGHVKLRSGDARQAPQILFNYFSTTQDRQEMRDGIRLTREIFAQKAFDPYRGRELAPGEAAQSDAEVDAFAREHTESAYHPSCTCKMGVDDMAVVDSQARVHGIDKLRVIDASIMPSIVSGNLNMPTMMIAEKMADVIKGRGLPPDPQPFYRAENWRTQQR